MPAVAPPPTQHTYAPGNSSPNYVAHSPIVIGTLVRLLQNYPFKEDATFLYEGFMHGFKLGYTGRRQSCEARNLPSLTKNLQAAKDIIKEEVAAGRVAGPFKQPPLPSLRCSPIGLIPKHSSAKFRLIHHLSWPHGNSVNDGISPDAARVAYTSFDRVIESIVRLGRGALLAKADVKSAFRLLPIHPDDYQLLGFKFEGSYYFDMAQPFGARSSCATWERLAKLINWSILQGSNSDATAHHYLDDYIFVGRGAGCQSLLDTFIQLCNQLGVPLAGEKMEGPATIITFLGLTIDTNRMQVRVPAEKVAKALKLINNLIERKRIRLRTLQSVIGSLQFLCKAIKPGRPFLQRLIALTRGISKPFYSVRISPGAKLDAIMWQQFLTHFNGTSAFLPASWQDSSNLQFYTDASKTLGYGAYFAGKWFYGQWPSSANNWSIAVCELFPIVLGLMTWASAMRQKKVTIWCDNKSVTEVINKQASHCPKLMILMRALTLVCLEHNILIRALHIVSFCNKIADSLSRGKIDQFRALAPDAEMLPTPTPGAPGLLSALKSLA